MLRHGGTEAQASSVRNRRQSMPGEDRGEVRGTPPRNGPTTTNAMENGQRLETPSSESVVEDLSQPTQENRRKERLKWTHEMNEYLYRSYLTITGMETTSRPYSVELYRTMVAKFPNLQTKTVQNILDQRRQLFISNRIPISRTNEIRKEVEIELGLRTPDLPQPLTPTPPDHHAVNEEAANWFEKYLLLYTGINPIYRPRIPRLKTNKQTSSILTSVKNILSLKVENVNNLQDLYELIYTGALTTVHLHGQRVNSDNANHNKRQSKPAWERRLENKITNLRKDIAHLTQKITSVDPNTKAHKKGNIVIEKYSGKDNKTATQILDFLKQQLGVYSNRLRRYRESNARRAQEYLFHADQKAFYRALTQKTQHIHEESPNQDETAKFWEAIWAKPVLHNRRAVWIADEKKRVNKTPIMTWNTVDEVDVKEAISKTQNWKAPGPDGVHNFWLKRFDMSHKVMAKIFTEYMQGTADIPDFLTTGVTHLIPKSVPASKDPAKYRPITCLPSMYKILTSIISDKIYRHLENHNLLPEEQKGCRKGRRGCQEQLIIDSIICGEAKNLKKSLFISYIDYKKAFDSIPHSLLIEVLQIYKISPAIITLMEKLMPKWKTNLMLSTSSPKAHLAEIPIRRGIFQGDALSALWFCLALTPLSAALRKKGKGYKLQSGLQIDHLAYMDDIKLFSNSSEGLDILLKTLKKYSQDTAMELGLDKCRVNTMKDGIWKEHSGFRLSAEQVIEGMDEDETYKYLGIDQARGIEHNKMKQILREKLRTRVKSVLKTQLSAINKTNAINTYAIPSITYSYGIIKWSRTDLQELDRMIRVMFTKYRARHPKSAVERFYLPRGEGGRGIINLESMYFKQVDALRNFFYKTSETSLYHEMIIRNDKSFTPLNLQNKNYHPMENVTSNDILHQNWKSKQLHGRYPSILASSHIDKRASNEWLTRGKLFAETEGFLMAIQDQVIPTLNYRKYIIGDPSVTDDRCRLCHANIESVEHIISACSFLASTDYVKRHDNVAKIIHQELCINVSLLQNKQPYYRYKPESVIDTPDYKIYWNRTILTDHTVEHNRPDIVFQDKKSKTTYLIDIAIPAPHNIHEKQAEKIRKYLPLAAEVKNLWNQEKTVIIPIVVGATGEIPVKLKGYLDQLNMPHKLYQTLQRVAILGTCHIMRKTLNI